MPKIREADMTLQQYAVLAGFERQKDVAMACAANGTPIPQSVLSSMYRGNPAYPKARAAVSYLFWPAQCDKGQRGRQRAERRLLSLIQNSA